jgi:hypothetical protein
MPDATLPAFPVITSELWLAPPETVPLEISSKDTPIKIRAWCDNVFTDLGTDPQPAFQDNVWDVVINQGTPLVRYNPVPCTVLSRHPFPARRSAPEANGLQGAITPLERPRPVAPPQNRSHATQLRRVARRLSMASYLHSLHSSSYLFLAGQTAEKLLRRDLPCMRQPAHRRLRHRYPAISMLCCCATLIF